MSGQGAIISQYLHSFKPHFLLCPGLRLVTGLSAEVRNQLVDVSVSAPCSSLAIVTHNSTQLSQRGASPHTQVIPMCGADSGYSDINTLPIMPLQYRQHRAAQELFCYSVCVHVQRSVVWWQHRGGDITAILRRYYGHKAAVPAAHRSPAPRCLIGRFYWRKCGVT